MNQLQNHPEIIRVNSLIIKLITQIEQLNKSTKALNNMGYDSDCSDRIVVICQKARSIICLAETDLNFFYSATIICRTLLEASAKVEWILNASSVDQREARWLAFLIATRKKINDLRGEIRTIDNAGYSEEFMQCELDELSRVIDAVSKGISTRNQKTRILKGLPDLKQILTYTDASFAYFMYCEMSDAIHSSHLTSGLYSSEYGLNEAGIIREWWKIYSIIYFSLKFGVRSYMVEKFNNEKIIPAEDKIIEAEIHKVFELANRLKSKSAHN